VMQESDTFASYLKSTATSLLSLVGIEADPLESKEYILLAQIITHAWLASENLSIESIIGKIINPPFKKIGVLVLDDFYDKERALGWQQSLMLSWQVPVFRSGSKGRIWTYKNYSMMNRARQRLPSSPSPT